MNKPFRTRVAETLRAVANRIEPPAVPLAITDSDPGPGEQMLFAQKCIADWTLRSSLHTALHRYSPKEKPAQA